MWNKLKLALALIGLLDKLKNSEDKTGMKKGIATSEFWTAIVSSIVGILVILGWITPDVQNDLVLAAEKLVGGILAIAGVVAYILGRSKVKTAHEYNIQPEGE